MPRYRRMMDYRMSKDGRNPYGAAGGYVVNRRRDRARNRDMLMMEDMRKYNRGESDYELSDMTRQNQEIRHNPYMPRDYETGEVYAGVDDFYSQNDMARGRGRDRARDYADYEYDMARSGRGGRGRDGHYPMGMGEMYYPIEAMGYFNGYYGMGQDHAYDMARGGRGRGRDRGYDYAYDYAGDYGEKLGKEELSHWGKKLMNEMEDKDKQFFSRENILKRAKELGIKFDKFNEDEFYITTLMVYTDYCKTLGTANIDIYLRLAKDWLEDDDVSTRFGEKLAVYHDCIVEGEEYDD